MAKRAVAVLISGSGSNLQALIDACEDASYPCRIALVISNKANAYGLTRAANAGIPTKVIRHTDYASREAFDDAMHAALQEHGVEIVCLAGFMRLLTPSFVKRWHDRILNIHPSLLPAFKGLHVQEQAIKYGAKFSGCTVHLVRAEMDVGPIIIQAAVPILQGDTQEILASRILVQEHICYPKALRWLAEGRITIENETVRIDGVNQPQSATLNPLA